MQIIFYSHACLLSQMLNDAQIGNKPIDNAMNDAGQLGRVKAYVADPPLVRVHEAGFPSTIDVFDRRL